MRSGHPIIGIGLNSAGLPAAIQGDACPDHPDTGRASPEKNGLRGVLPRMRGLSRGFAAL
jgi:hypothetical protein